MKTILSLAILSVIPAVMAQTPPPPTKPLPLPPPPPAAEAPEGIIEDVQRTTSEAVRSALKAAQNAVAQAGNLSRNAYDSALQFGRGTRPSSRSLAVHSTTVDDARTDALEEDLSVMGRILQKAARSMREDERFNAMGLDLDSSVFGSASGARNLYIEGYGALFLLSVKYPLVAPPQPEETPEPNGEADSEWERTREEVLGVSPDRAGGVWKSSSRGSLEKYDEEKVNGLKTALLQALKNASHIRSLTPEEWITVVIQGGLAMDGNILLKGAGGGKHVEVEVRRKEVRTNGGGAVTVVKRSGSPGETVMTLRVKKADVDALAGDKMTFDTFQKKAAIQAYIRRDAETDRPVRR